MDYIKQLNAFELWLETNYLPGTSQLIWYKLFMLFNRCGWAEWVTVDNYRLMVLADIKSETTFINNRDKLINTGLIEYQKGKKGTPNKYRMIQLYTIENTPENEVKKSYTPNFGADTELKRSENASQNGVETLDINKRNKTKQNNIIDMSNDISPVAALRQRYTPEQLKVIDEFFGILKHTRKSAKLAGSVVLQIYQDWEKHEAGKVIYALHKYIHTPTMHDKKESYVLGIINNTTMADIEQYKNSLNKNTPKANHPSRRASKFHNYEGRKWDYDAIERAAQKKLNEG